MENNIKVTKSISYKAEINIERGIVSGFFSIYDVLDKQNDVILDGAFDSSIYAHNAGVIPGVKHLFNHNTDKIVGKIITLENRETADGKRGLYFDTMIIDTKTSKEVYELYKNGIIDNHSIGFFIDNYRIISYGDEEYNKYSNTDVGDIRIIVKATLIEGSSVLWGANPYTETVSVKNDDNGKICCNKNTKDSLYNMSKINWYLIEKIIKSKI